MRFLQNSVKFGIILFGIFALVSFSYAQDYASSNFILRDPVITIAGGQSSSLDFQYFSSSGQLSPGESSSSDYTYRAGFLYFPTATSPVLSATPGDARVDLSWTASVGTLANITHYELGISTFSGGPYTYEDVGNVLLFSKTSLTNGIQYYFKLKADAGTLTVAQSAQVSATPTSSSGGDSTGGGAGGGGSGAQITFSGKAYPNSIVTILKDGQITATTIADSNANFQTILSGLYDGNYNFILYAKDNQGRISSSVNLPKTLISGVPIQVNNIFIGPTFVANKGGVKKGDNISFVGQGAPNTDIKIVISADGNKEFFGQATVDGTGNYSYSFDTSGLAMDQYFAKSQASLGGLTSFFSQSINFKVGTQNILVKPEKEILIRGDLNRDGRVDLVDLSIIISCFNSPTPPVKVDFNGDGTVDLTDVSILVYYWTG